MSEPLVITVPMRVLAQVDGPGSSFEGGSVADVVPDLSEGCGDDPSWICERVTDWTNSDSWGSAADWFVAKPFAIVITVVVAWLVGRVLKAVVRRSIERSMTGEAGHVRQRIQGLRSRAVEVLAETEDPKLRAEARAQTLITVSRGLISLFVWFVAFLVILGIIGIDLAPLLAGAGILGVALGFGAQDLVKDFIAGTFIIIEDQYGVGDVVDLGEATGTVENVTLRVTKLRDVDGNVWHVPNGEIARVGNKSQEWSRALLDLDVAYDTDLDRASEVIQRTAEAMAADPEWQQVILDTPELWGVEAFGADAVSIRLVTKTRPGEQWKVLREMRRRMKDAFDAEGIEIPFPQRVVTMPADRDDDAG